MSRSEKSSDEQETLIHGDCSRYGSDNNEKVSVLNNQISSLSHAITGELSNTRPPSRLEWAQSSWTRCMHVLWFFWLERILRLGNKQILNDDDLEELPHHDKCSVLLNKLLIYDWSTSAWSTIQRSFGKDIFYAGLFVIPYIGARLGQTLFLRAIIQHISHKHEISFHVQVGVVFAVGLCACCIAQSILHQQLFFRSARIGIRIRNALSATIYQRLLSTAMSSLQQRSAAQIINLVANDVSRYEDFWAYAHFIWQTPLECLLTFCLLTWIIGILPTLFGFLVILPFAPLQFILSRHFSRCRQATIIHTDKRIDAFSQILNGYQILKMYNWEQPMEDNVRKIREDELVQIKYASHLRAFMLGLFFASSSLVAFMIVIGIWLVGSEIKPADIFTALACLGQLRLPLFNLMPFAMERLSLALAASKRIDAFMKMNTMQPRKRQPPMTTNREHNNEQGIVVLRDASFSWEDQNLCLSSVNIIIKSGQFVGIVGPVGAGKSSLLAAILGEISLTTGHLQVNGSISYAAQCNWIFADTIRANILLGKELDQERYMRVLCACCLDVDLKALGKAGDLTVIGEKGINLSGGQRARISLARALYVDADIYLLDDPLAACDPKVAKEIFNACIGPQGLLNKKTRILVTHQTHFLTAADQCIIISNGRINAQGAVDKVFQNHGYELQLNGDDWNYKQADQLGPISADELDLRKAVADSKSIIHDEITISGSVSWSIWQRLLTAPPLGWFGCFLLIVLLLVGEILFQSTNFWLAMWSSQTSRAEKRSVSLLYVYTALTVGTFITALVRADYFFYIMLRGSTCLHNDMLKGILYTSMRFFESNPSGRILNRASRDQQIVDEVLPRTLFDSLQSLLTTFGSVVIISLINPAILVLLVPVVPICCYLHRYYLQTSRQLKRLESVSRSPIYTLFSSSLNGLSTIRAFQVQNTFIQTFMNRIDMNTRAYMSMIGTFHWFGLRIDLIASLFVLFIAVFATITNNEIDPSYVALTLICCLNMTTRFQWGLLQLAETQNYMTSAERLDEYTRLPLEEDNGGDRRLIRPPSDWPNRGSIEFRNYTLRYRPELEPVLRNINLRIESDEKIGIIGRTGAGKSSLFQALFRLVERSTVDGQILIDDVDISRLTLSHLRSHLSVIPQMPILFSGTIRYNLDPLHIHTDEQCFAALEAVQLKLRICDHPDGLHLQVAEFGNNFSFGERQLICVARAILKKSKILLIDEATANIDYETDALIQNIITKEFPDRTILTIAHRLHTVARSNRILVMEGGRAVKFDVPNNIFHQQQPEQHGQQQ